MRQFGFSLIEILISLVITSVGLLGLAALQGKAQKAEMESYQHAQALLGAQDMVERIRAIGGVPGTAEISAWNTTLSANLINAKGCVEPDPAAPSFKVIIIWQGLLEIGQQSNPNKCNTTVNNGRFISIPVQLITPSN